MDPDRLSMTFAALADPTRRAILARLTSGTASVQELAEPFDVSLAAISKHLKVLARTGLITQRREGQWRPCKLNADPLREVAQWVEQYRQFWEEGFDRLDDYLRELQTGEHKEESTEGNRPFHGAEAGTPQPHSAGESKERDQ